MLVECECGKQFITEADTYVVIPTLNYKLNCGCYFDDKNKSEREKEDDTKHHSCGCVTMWGETLLCDKCAALHSPF